MIKLPHNVQKAINVIIRNENCENAEIEINQGSDSGDGYASKTFAVSIKGKKTLNLFIKCTHDVIKESWDDMITYLFKTEYNFYNKIYPEFKKFEETKKIEDPFNNVPTFYGGDVEDEKLPPLVLQNIKTLGYKLRDRKKPIDDDHLRIPIKAFAKYHAISFALKDQQPEIFERLSKNLKAVFFGKNFEAFGLADMVKISITQFTESLNPFSDKIMLDKCKNLNEKIINFAHKMGDILDEYYVIVQGDCWSSNMMFLYDETQKPIDVKLIDWQVQSLNSPLLDFNYFFYTLATKKELDNTHHYLNLYYNTLTQRIKDLGSDPNKVYPYNVFVEHWRQTAMFGLCMAFCVVKAQLFESDEIPVMVEETGFQAFGRKIKSQDKYIERIRDLIDYFINQKLL